MLRCCFRNAKIIKKKRITTNAESIYYLFSLFSQCKDNKKEANHNKGLEIVILS